MEIILLENVEQLGMRGEIINVKPGYARNFLIPKGIGAKVTPDNLRKLDSLRKKLKQDELEHMGMLRELAARLNSISLTIQAKASAEGHLFGSVTTQMISDALTAEGVEIDSKAIHLEENIKEVGVYTVPVNFHSEIQAKLRVWVVEERSAEEGGSAAKVEISDTEPGEEDEK